MTMQDNTHSTRAQPPHTPRMSVNAQRGGVCASADEDKNRAPAMPRSLPAAPVNAGLRTPFIGACVAPPTSAAKVTGYSFKVEIKRDHLNREPHVRLRQALKILLRAFAFRATSIEEITETPTPADAAGKTQEHP